MQDLPPELQESLDNLRVLEGDGVHVSPGLPVEGDGAGLTLGADALALPAHPLTPRGRLLLARDVAQGSELALGHSGRQLADVAVERHKLYLLLAQVFLVKRVVKVGDPTLTFLPLFTWSRHLAVHLMKLLVNLILDHN